MKDERQIPSFDTEDEEAQWWFDHREQTADWLEKAAGEGRTTNLAELRESRRTPRASISDYLKMLLHEALEQGGRKR